MQYLEEIEKYIGVIQKYDDVPNYFLNILRDIKKENSEKTPMKVGIIGDEFYGLYVRSYGLTPVFLKGGSYRMGENASHIFPQISDPIAKAAVGLLLDPELNLVEELEAIIISASNDSFKKAMFYLKDLNLNIIQVEPPSYMFEKMPFKFISKQLQLLNSISKLTNTVFNIEALKTEIKGYQDAYALMASSKWQALPIFLQSFFLQTLHMDEDKDFWLIEMEKYLSLKTETSNNNSDKFSLRLAGSEIHIPNSKFHEILFEVGITHYKDTCVGLVDFSKVKLNTNAFSLIKNCFAAYYNHLFTTKNINLTGQFNFLEDTQGIIFYLLKGQTTDSYTAERMEEFALKADIPFLCIETDYTDTDKEQIRIRVEAFYEMLSGNLSKKPKLKVG
ncbi:hypothetical protein AN640_01145 [Candidatus Epulonipiscium fishelsonii]|uniref:Uncharacterized protein n=1 Tax=Candidatus Epulonipiscium fishelsonii TaxID=77094 RepID=A0ACC8XHY6_9FIRM|nr:hypothetical protein AN640_01145 [Epulopiscium sp. SCG-D08WGA-EpuloA1]